MNIERKIELIKDWGFTSVGHRLYSRMIFDEYTEFWSPNKPDHIDFHRADDNTFNHDYKIDWSLFEKVA